MRSRSKKIKNKHLHLSVIGINNTKKCMSAYSLTHTQTQRVVKLFTDMIH